MSTHTCKEYLQRWTKMCVQEEKKKGLVNNSPVSDMSVTLFTATSKKRHYLPYPTQISGMQPTEPVLRPNPGIPGPRQDNFLSGFLNIFS